MTNKPRIPTTHTRRPPLIVCEIEPEQQISATTLLTSQHTQPTINIKHRTRHHAIQTIIRTIRARNRQARHLLPRQARRRQSRHTPRLLETGAPVLRDSPVIQIISPLILCSHASPVLTTILPNAITESTPPERLDTQANSRDSNRISIMLLRQPQLLTSKLRLEPRAHVEVTAPFLGQFQRKRRNDLIQHARSRKPLELPLIRQCQVPLMQFRVAMSTQSNDVLGAIGTTP